MKKAQKPVIGIGTLLVVNDLVVCPVVAIRPGDVSGELISL